jgi:hypothetical protein
MTIKKAGRLGKVDASFKISIAGRTYRRKAKALLFDGIDFRTNEGRLKALAAKRITGAQSIFLRFAQTAIPAIKTDELRMVWPLFERITLDPLADYYKRSRLDHSPETVISMRLNTAFSIHNWALDPIDGMSQALISSTSPIIIRDIRIDRDNHINYLRTENDGKILLRGTKPQGL